MRSRFFRLPVYFLCAAAFAAAPEEPSLEFSAYLRVGDKTHFVLIDRATATSSGCIGFGNAFRGYTAALFDPKTETLTLRPLECPAGALVLPLKQSRVQDALTLLRRERTLHLDASGALSVAGVSVPPAGMPELLGRLAAAEPPGRITLSVEPANIAAGLPQSAIDALIAAATDLPPALQRFGFVSSTRTGHWLQRTRHPTRDPVAEQSGASSK